MAGDGLAIDPTGDVFVAPADGELNLIFKTNHAFALTLNNGVELLVHIGVDTVSLDGEGFERLIEPGVKVKAGTPIIKINRDFILSKGFSLATPVLITNLDDSVKEFEALVGNTVQAGQDIVLTYKTK